jgi:molybdate transport system regulatory protein
MKPVPANVQPRFRVMRGRDVAIGPGKAELLEHVLHAGSIMEAAKRMGMSYNRAWLLFKTMERCFKEPLLKVARGGVKHGGAELTENGRRVLELYRKMERESLKSTARTRSQILRLLAD